MLICYRSPYTFNAEYDEGKPLMTDDDRGFIDRAESLTEKIYGRPMTTGDIADDFALYGLKKRAGTLEDLDTELRGEIDSSPHNLRRRVQLMALRKKMGGVHAALRKARR
jgi:hypothetical protein